MSISRPAVETVTPIPSASCSRFAVPSSRSTVRARSWMTETPPSRSAARVEMPTTARATRSSVWSCAERAMTSLRAKLLSGNSLHRGCPTAVGHASHPSGRRRSVPDCLLSCAMERNRALERLTADLRRHPFAVDVAITALVVVVTVLLPAATYPNEAPAAYLGLLITVPLAWRRRAPIPAAAAMIVAGLLQLVVSPTLLVADVAVLPMIYALAAYAPRWAGRAGLGIGLLGSLLAGLRFYSYEATDALLVSVFTGGIAVVAAWALGDLRRARV